METGAAGNVMPAEVFPASETGSDEHNKEVRCSKWRKDQRLGVKTMPFQSVEGVHRCTKIQERKRCEAFDLDEKGRASWQCRGAG